MRLFSCLAFLLSIQSCVIIDQFFQPGTSKYKKVNRKYSSLSEAHKNNSNHKVLVAVIDSGVDYTHPALKKHMHYNLKELAKKFNSQDEDRNAFVDDFLGYDFTGNDGLPFYALLTPHQVTGKLVRDIDEESIYSAEHGTHVAGIVVGKDPRIGIIPFRVLPLSANKTTKIKPDYIDLNPIEEKRNSIQSIKIFTKYLRDSIYLAKRQGARVANISMGESPSGDISESHIKKAFEKLRKYISSAASNMVITVSAGNEQEDISSGSKVMPCQLRSGNVLCVGSVNNKGELSEFTNNGLQFVDIYAPGEDILSAYPLEHAEFNETKPYIRMSGTSMAAPYIANVIAKMLIYKSCLSSKEIISILKKTATKRRARIIVGNSNKADYPYLVVNRDKALRAAKSASCKR